MKVFYGQIVGYEDRRPQERRADNWREALPGRQGIIYLLYMIDGRCYIRFFEGTPTDGMIHFGKKFRTGPGQIKREGSRLTITTENSRYTFEIEDDLTAVDESGSVSREMVGKITMRELTSRMIPKDFFETMRADSNTEEEVNE